MIGAVSPSPALAEEAQCSEKRVMCGAAKALLIRDGLRLVPGRETPSLCVQEVVIQEWERDTGRRAENPLCWHRDPWKSSAKLWLIKGGREQPSDSHCPKGFWLWWMESRPSLEGRGGTLSVSTPCPDHRAAQHLA